MLTSVVVRSKDEAPRLRLTLASLARQTVAAEVVVVDDGSADATPAVLAEASRALPLTIVRHATPRGRAGAANAGARAATGDVLLFLDGDTLAAPEFVARHAALHEAAAARGEALVGRGETWHLRGTRFLLDPEAGTPRPGEEARVERLPPSELARMKVTRVDIRDDFAGIERRGEPGIYPGAGPRRLYEVELDALIHHPDCPALWAAASGANFSVGRDPFLRVGGFVEALDINEHRELALRLCRDGARMAFVGGARTYHLTHRTGWRDPLADTGWEETFHRAHPLPEVKLLAVFWAGLSGHPAIPPEARIRSLPHLAAIARGDTSVDYDAIRRRIDGLPELAAAAVPHAGAPGRT